MKTVFTTANTKATTTANTKVTTTANIKVPTATNGHNSLKCHHQRAVNSNNAKYNNNYQTRFVVRNKKKLMNPL